jgi:hypothetical protein
VTAEHARFGRDDVTFRINFEQQDMNAETLSKLQSLGVMDDSRLRLDFYYDAPAGEGDHRPGVVPDEVVE